MCQYSGLRSVAPARSGVCSSNLTTLRAIAKQRRREHVWGWASLLLLLLCWDATLRLDEKVSIPRPRLTHAIELEREALPRTEAPKQEPAAR